ncbi:MAG: ABC transporter permease [Armatimonadetes bacterium]|nr:ABC transporter permease [Armatimonadota bacterium]
MFLKGLELAAPLILAGLGGLFSERSGVMNIALEGKMLGAAVTAALVSVATGSAAMGLLAGILAAIILSLIHGVLTQTYRIDHIVSGMAINAISFGAARFCYAQFTDQSRNGEIPHFSEAVYWGLAALAPILVALYLKTTKGGLRLLAVGNDPDKAREAGINPVVIRYQSLVICGILCGIAGVLIVTKTGRYSDDLTAGKGFIALAALVVGGWRPIPTLIACIFFAMCEALQFQMQGGASFLSQVPAQYWNALPYIATIIALAVLGGKWKAPSGLGKP